MKLGIVGLPNVGKSTLFNALTNAGAESANYPFCTIEPNVGIVKVPDARLDKLAEINEKLESEEISLDDSIKLFKEGLELSKLCQKKLDEAKLEIQKIEIE